MTTTPNPNAIDLTKPTNVGESTCQLLIMPHVPSFNAMRQIACETSTVLVNQTNLIQNAMEVTLYDHRGPYDSRRTAAFIIYKSATK